MRSIDPARLVSKKKTDCYALHTAAKGGKATSPVHAVQDPGRTSWAGVSQVHAFKWNSLNEDCGLLRSASICGMGGRERHVKQPLSIQRSRCSLHSMV